jgi:hypothetical protein
MAGGSKSKHLKVGQVKKIEATLVFLVDQKTVFII